MQSSMHEKAESAGPPLVKGRVLDSLPNCFFYTPSAPVLLPVYDDNIFGFKSMPSIIKMCETAELKFLPAVLGFLLCMFPDTQDPHILCHIQLGALSLGLPLFHRADTVVSNANKTT